MASRIPLRALQHLPATLTISEAGEILGVGRSVAYERARAGGIPTLRLSPRRVVVPTAALLRLLQVAEPVDEAG